MTRSTIDRALAFLVDPDEPARQFNAKHNMLHPVGDAFTVGYAASMIGNLLGELGWPEHGPYPWEAQP